MKRRPSKTFRIRATAAGSFRLAGDVALVKLGNRFLDALDVRGLSPQTLRAYGYDLLSLQRWLDAARKQLRQLQQVDLIDFIRQQKAKGAKPRSINRQLTTIRIFYRFCIGKDLPAGRGAIHSSPHYKGRGRERDLGLHRLRKPRRLDLRVRTPKELVEPLTPDQVRRFLASLRRYRDLAIVYLMLCCGLRSREVISLRLHDLLSKEQSIRVRGKGRKERMVPLPDFIRRVLDDYLRFERPGGAGESLFVVLQGARRGKAIGAEGLRSLFRRRREDPRIRNANAHRFRHTFGADMARAGVRLPVLQRLMGHADGSTTLQYINLNMADVADAYQRAMLEIRRRYRHG